MALSPSDELDVLVTGTLAAALPPACCGASAASSRASFLLHVRVLQTRATAGLVQLQWRCVASGRSSSSCSRWHSWWVDAGDVARVTRVVDANAALGRGAHEPPLEDECGGRVALWRTADAADARGRFLVATKPLAVGDRVLRAAAFAVAVAQPLALRRCHWCFARLVRKALRCGACEFALYCSRECLDADAPLHDVQCRALAQLHRMAGSAALSEWSSAGVDAETIRLALAALSMERFVGSTAPLSGLALNRRATTRDREARALAQAARFVANALAGDSLADEAHVSLTLERVRCNAHPLVLSGAATVGVGLFPEAAQALNHSCLPNVVAGFDRRTRTLSFHAIRAIGAREAVAYAYVELFQDVARRRRALQSGFGFACDCWRCVQEAQGGAQDEDDDEEEEEAMRALAQLSEGGDAHVRAEQLFRRRAAAFARSPELLAAYRTLQLQLATARHDWGRVIREAEALERAWLERGLPATHPTVEALQLQVLRAAQHAGSDAAVAQRAREKVRRIRRVCGFEDDEDERR